MITLALAFLKAVPLKVWAVVAAVALLLGFLGWERHRRTVLERQLVETRQVLEQIKAQGSETKGRLDISLKRIDDIDVRSKWLLKEFGENLPKTEEEARQWAIRAAREISQ